MNDKWLTKDGKRWGDPHHIRVARRFRRHIRTKSNPNGRVHREPCHVCWYKHDIARRGEAHHPDYKQPYLVVWLCHDHHRQADHGSLKVTKSMLWDYSSVIRHRSHLHRENLVPVLEPRGGDVVRLVPRGREHLKF